MPLFVLMTNLTDEGRQTVKQRPDRIKLINVNYYCRSSCLK